MKKLLVKIIILNFILLGQTTIVKNISIATENTSAAFVMCSKDKTMCTVGEYTMRGSKTQPLYINDGIVCTHDKKMCTNGFQILTSTSADNPIYIAENNNSSSKFIMCTTDKKVCALGKYTIRSSGTETLFIGNGIVCTPDKNVALTVLK